MFLVATDLPIIRFSGCLQMLSYIYVDKVVCSSFFFFAVASDANFWGHISSPEQLTHNVYKLEPDSSMNR